MMNRINRAFDSAARMPARLMLAFLTLCLAFLAIDPWHNWGGDYAYYLGVARNIYFDRPLETGNVGVVAPTGFSWILSKVAPLLEWNFLSIKRLNLVWTLIYCILVLGLSRYISGTLWSVAFVAISTLNFGIWYYANQILTELLFLAIVTGFFLILIGSKSNTIWRSVILLFLLALLACWFRQAALLLLFVPPLVYWDYADLRMGPRKALTVGGLLCLSAVSAYLVYNASWFHAAAHSHLAADEQGFSAKVLFMLRNYDTQLSALAAGILGDLRSAWWGGAIAIMVLISLAYRIARFKFSVAIFLFALIIPIAYVPWTPPDGRYWFPLLAVISFLAIEGLASSSNYLRLKRDLNLGYIALSAVIGILALHHLGTANRIFLYDRDRGVFEKHAGDMFYWLHYNTEWGARVCFFKPRILGYHANWNNVCLVDQNSSPEEIEAALNNHADYVVVSDQYDEKTWRFFIQLDDPRIVYRNERFVIVRRGTQEE